MTEKEKMIHNKKMREKANKDGATVLEFDDNGVIVGYGSDVDYDTHASDVMNGYGYYDDNGHYRSYRQYDDYDSYGGYDD